MVVVFLVDVIASEGTLVAVVEPKADHLPTHSN